MFKLKQIVAISSLLFATSYIAHAMPLDAVNYNLDDASAESTVLSRLSEANASEIEAGTLAAAQADRQDVKDFGSTLVTEHTAAQANLMEIATKESIAFVKDYPMTPEEKVVIEKQRADLDKLKSLEGKEFEKSFLQSAVDCHNFNITFLQGQRPNLKNASVIAFVDEMIAKITAHRDLAAKLLAGSR